MTIHMIEPDAQTLHGHFSRDLPAILTINAGDTVRYRTLDAGWSLIEQPDPFNNRQKFVQRDRERDPGHALCGPIAIQEAQAGATLAIYLKTIRTATWGWSVGGGFASPWNTRLGLADGPDYLLGWTLDPDQATATSQRGHAIQIRPFMGILGMPPDEAGRHSTFPPRVCGGNIDCKDLVVGSTLYLPIAVDGGLFSLGDGHAAQGDGEVSGPALECPMECVEVEFQVHTDMHLAMPRARTPAGSITFGFHEDLNEAAMIAVEGMLDLIQEQFAAERKEALALASLVVDLHITQIVNGVRGVHAILPHNAIQHAAPHLAQ